MSVIINENNHLKYFDDSNISPEEIEQKEKPKKELQTESTDENSEDKPKIQFFTE